MKLVVLSTLLETKAASEASVAARLFTMLLKDRRLARACSIPFLFYITVFQA